MARPRKNNAEWFSHDRELRNDRKVKAVRQKFGAEGYAAFVMFLEVLADAEDFKVRFSENEIDLLAGDFEIETEKLEQIVNFFLKVGLLQVEDGYLLNEHLIERLSPLTKKRASMRQLYQETKGDKKPERKPGEPPEDEAPKKPTKPKAETMSEEDFDTFWAKYPLKEDKKKSKEKFLRLPKALLETILSAIEENKTKNRKWIEGFIPHPTTWLNGERWNDELAPLLPNQSKSNGKNVSTAGKTPSESSAGKVSDEGTADLVV